MYYPRNSKISFILSYPTNFQKTNCLLKQDFQQVSQYVKLVRNWNLRCII